MDTDERRWAALREAGIPILHVRARAAYDVAALRQDVARALAGR